jgi:hypothetical protein
MRPQAAAQGTALDCAHAIRYKYAVRIIQAQCAQLSCWGGAVSGFDISARMEGLAS